MILIIVVCGMGLVSELNVNNIIIIFKIIRVRGIKRSIEVK